MTGESGVSELVHGGISTGTSAAAGPLPALPTAATAAATAAAAAAAAAIAGLGAKAPGEGGAPAKPGASHPLTGLSRQKQVNKPADGLGYPWLLLVVTLLSKRN